MSNERSMSGSRPYRSIVNAGVLRTVIILACATAGVCPQGCVTVLGNATARLRSRLSKPCDINATVTEPRPSGSGFRRKSPKPLSTPDQGVPTALWYRRVMQNSDGISRRNLLKQSTFLSAGASALSMLQPRVARAAANDRLKAGLVGCGGRGTQAVVDLLTGNEHVELVGMADVFEDHLEQSL